MKVYFNNIRTPSRHTEAQSYPNEHESNQQHFTVPRATRGIAVEREIGKPICQRRRLFPIRRNESRKVEIPNIQTYYTYC